MHKRMLAKILRNKQIKVGSVPKEVVASMSDDDIIDSYITCSQCGERLVDTPQLQQAILKANTIDQFFNLCGMGQHMQRHQEEDEESATTMEFTIYEMAERLVSLLENSTHCRNASPANSYQAEVLTRLERVLARQLEQFVTAMEQAFDEPEPAEDELLEEPIDK